MILIDTRHFLDAGNIANNKTKKKPAFMALIFPIHITTVLCVIFKFPLRIFLPIASKTFQKILKAI
jgi:hypothetical protein